MLRLLVSISLFNKEVQRPGRILCPLLQQGHQGSNGPLDLLFRRGNDGVVHFHSEDDKHHLSQLVGMVKVDLPGLDALADDLGQHRLELGDQVVHVGLMEKGLLLGTGPIPGTGLRLGVLRGRGAAGKS